MTHTKNGDHNHGREMNRRKIKGCPGCEAIKAGREPVSWGTSPIPAKYNSTNPVPFHTLSSR